MTTSFQQQPILTEAKQSLKLALPLIASFLVQALSGFAGVFFAARLGRDALDASALVSSIYITIIVFLFGVLSAVSVLIAQYAGAKNKIGIQKVFSQSLIFSVLLGIVVSVLIWFAPVALDISKQNAQVIQLSTVYLHALSFCVVPLMILVSMEQFLIGISCAKIVLCISVIEVPFEILAIYALTFGKFGLPKLGIAGLGYGFVIVFILTAIVLGLYLHLSKTCRHYNLFSRLGRIYPKYFWDLMHIGCPIGVMYIIELALYMVITFMMARFGANVLGAHQIALQFVNVTYMIIFAMSQTAAVRVGDAVGKNNKLAAKRAMHVNMALSTAIMLVIAFCFLAFPKTIISLDINIHDPKFTAIVHYAVIFLSIAVVAQMADNFRFIALGALRGLKDTTVPMYISAVIFWLVILPLAYFAGFTLHLGGTGIWWSIVAGVSLSVVIFIIRFNRFLHRVDFSKLLV